MTDSKIYLEGGGVSGKLHDRCREGFRKLLEGAGFKGRMPRLVACGGRGETFDDFKTAQHKRSAGAYVAMLVDSEDPVKAVDKPWAHLRNRDGWGRPAHAVDDQVFLMTTCMETWIVADREALKRHYRNDCLKEKTSRSEGSRKASTTQGAGRSRTSDEPMPERLS